MRFIDGAEVRARLTYDLAIPLVREAMIAVSAGRTRQLLRSILSIGGEDLFGVMPGSLGEGQPFGAKLISVFPGAFAAGGPSHQGVIVMFDPTSGAPVAVVDATEVTAIRTAAASAVATDALAREGPARLAILGYGRQAEEHLRAIPKVRSISEVSVWGRNAHQTAAFAKQMATETGLAIAPAANVRAAVEGADIVCTLTAASEPILAGAWIAAGTHVNLVGSGHAGQAEADAELIVRARLIADSRAGVIAQCGEFLRAKAAGRVDDAHVAAEIGEVLAGQARGRRDGEEITVYKSLGHVAQDLASAQALLTG
jgi:ornithine cyclodeaminase/alanine dehydrogenase-like protein (mu-crystallin family)